MREGDEGTTRQKCLNFLTPVKPRVPRRSCDSIRGDGFCPGEPPVKGGLCWNVQTRSDKTSTLCKKGLIKQGNNKL